MGRDEAGKKEASHRKENFIPEPEKTPPFHGWGVFIRKNYQRETTILPRKFE